MAICPLPAETVRLLGSSISITSPQALVKELLDNAIDANATSIEISISRNTLDKIQVRDNGQGISVDDLDSLGRRAHTSKIRHFDELRSKYGETLGFRGEALAGVNSIAKVQITTRTRVDPIASRVQLRSAVGGVETRCPISAPVGTTVSVTGLFESLPVRKQYVLNQTQKSISQIKHLIRAYTLARPYLKLTFKVLGDSAHSLSYSPGPKSTVREAVIQLFGRDLANDCSTVSYTTPTLNSGREMTSEITSQRLSCALEAFLPCAKSVSASNKNVGAFVSIDSRPITVARGLGKKLVKMFKTTFARFNAQGSKPFFHLSLKTPVGAYDANIAPLKDEVLFTDEESLLNAFATLCSNFLGASQEETRLTQIVSANQPSRPDREDIDTVSHASASVPQLLPEAGLGIVDSFLDEKLVSLYAGEESPQSAGHGPDENPTEKPNTMKIVKMRTTVNVNLARKESDATDEICSSGLMDIQLPTTPTMSFSIPEESRTITRLIPQTAQLGGNIETYFKPINMNSIEIATDETATFGKPPGVHDQAATTRRPLDELSFSALNADNRKVRRDATIPYAEGYDEGETLYDTLQDGSFDHQTNAVYHEGPAVSLRDSRDHTLAWEEALVDTTPRLQNEAFLQTPPTSGRRHHDALHQVPGGGRINDLSQLAQTNHNTRQVNHGRELQITRRRSPGLLQRSNRARESPQLDQSTRVPNFHAETNGIGQTLPTERLREPTLLQGGISPDRDVCVVNELTPRSNQPFSSFTNDCGPMTIGCDRYQHTSQLWLMRTPSPCEIEGTGHDEQTNANGMQLRSVHDLDTPRSREMRDTREEHAIANSMQSDDPRYYFITRRNTVKNSGREKRLASKGLPLEAVPSEQETHNLIQNFATDLHEISKQAHDIDLVDDKKIWGNALHFDDMPEVRRLERKLRASIEQLTGNVGDLGILQFTLTTKAKGKQRLGQTSKD